jgi:hypothetical protein
LLVFEGIKMGARVSINGKETNVTDQFLRYTFPVEGSVVLEIAFDPSIDTDGRFMACSGGWDWAPYTETYEPSGSKANRKTFSKGIWRSVYVVSGFFIQHVVPNVMYTGPYANSRLMDGAANFTVDVSLHLWSPTQQPADLSFRVVGLDQNAHPAWPARRVRLPAGESSTKLSVEVNGPRLWWPRDHGNATLYTLEVTAKVGGSTVVAERRIGFRTVALVTGDDGDPDYLRRASATQGTTNHTMFFRVNGAAIYARGANMIPQDALEGRLRDDVHRRMVISAMEAGMTILRVWGGGMWMPQSWYAACDELGVLVYHDMQYAQSGHDPASTPVQEEELRHQIRRLSAHPSIIIWDGCNECPVVMGTSTAIYATFVMATVAEEDHSRIVWPSCPAHGWESGVHSLTGLPTGSKLVSRGNGNLLSVKTKSDIVIVQSSTKPTWCPVAWGSAIEVHGPYRHGGGGQAFPAIDSGDGDAWFQAAAPRLSPQPTGTRMPSVFVSEFGGSVFSSFESMSATLAQEHWGIHGGAPKDATCKVDGGWHRCEGTNVMARRNYACDNYIIAFFGKTDLDAVGKAAFQEQLYKCMLGQALDMKREIEEQRSRNSFGMMVWQLGEIWPTGGWGSIEYASPRPGQIKGGRWKPLHHWYAQGLMQSVFAACGYRGTQPVCYVANDGPTPYAGDLIVEAVPLAGGRASTLLTERVALAAGPGEKVWHDLPMPDSARGFLSQHAIIVRMHGATPGGDQELVANFIPPKDMMLPRATVSCSVTKFESMLATLKCESDKFALHVVLTTMSPGRFATNAFFLLPGQPREIQFHAWEDGWETALAATLRVEHVALYSGAEEIVV